MFHISPVQAKVANENALQLECTTETPKVTVISDMKLFLAEGILK